MPSSTTGVILARALAAEIEQHAFLSHARHFGLAGKAEFDEELRALTHSLWDDMARTGPLWANVRLHYADRDLHPSSFMQGELTDGLIVHSRLNLPAVIGYLDDGATFIYNHLHESSYPIQRMQEILEYRVGAKVWIQAYLTKAKKTAFGLHCDQHNFIVLQLAGAKNWQVESGAGGVDERRLGVGEGIFLRSKTEHAVSGIGELSLHLTIAFDWLEATSAQPGSALKASDRESFSRSLRFGTAFPVALDRRMIDQSTGVRFAGRTQPAIEHVAGGVHLRCLGRQYRLDERLMPVLDLLHRGEEVTVTEIPQLTDLHDGEARRFAGYGVARGFLLCSTVP